MDGLTTFTAKYLILVPVVAVVLIVFKLKKGEARKKFLILLIATGILSLLLAEISRKLYYNPRPFLSDGVKPLFTASRDNGFPSDHTLGAAFLAFVSLSYSKRIGLALLVIAVLVGWARVAAGVHHAVDVAGSLVITGLSYWIIKYVLEQNSTKK